MDLVIAGVVGLLAGGVIAMLWLSDVDHVWKLSGTALIMIGLFALIPNVVSHVSDPGETVKSVSSHVPENGPLHELVVILTVVWSLASSSEGVVALVALCTGALATRYAKQWTSHS